jgi:hypothetical protein
MGYRGSKLYNRLSISLSLYEKEQRVDVNSFGQNVNPKVRYTLMAFERNYQIKFLSKQTLAPT